MSGVVDSSSILSDVGTLWDFEVVDKGECANAPLISHPGVQAVLNGLLFPIESGNVQVH
jgi:hypothetical protein